MLVGGLLHGAYVAGAVHSHYSTDADVLEGLTPYLASHHRKLAIRMCAVQNPLSEACVARALW